MRYLTIRLVAKGTDKMNLAVKHVAPLFVKVSVGTRIDEFTPTSLHGHAEVS